MIRGHPFSTYAEIRRILTPLPLYAGVLLQPPPLAYVHLTRTPPPPIERSITLTGLVEGSISFRAIHFVSLPIKISYK